MNSVYGFLAAQTLTCKPIAACVTAVGREMILQSKAYIESNYSYAEVVYGDTDSVFVKFETEKYKKLQYVKDQLSQEEYRTRQIGVREDIEKLSVKIGEDITKTLFKYPICLEYEKIYEPLILLKKKRYIGAYYSKSMSKYDFIDSKGVVTKRRDTFKLLNDAYLYGINQMIDNGELGVNAYVKYLEDTIHKIKQGDVNMLNLDDFVIIKKLNEQYKGKTIDDKGPFKVTKIHKNRQELEIKLPAAINVATINNDFCIKSVETGDTILANTVIIDDVDNLLYIKLKEVIPDTFLSDNIKQRKITLKNTSCGSSIPHVVLANKIGMRFPNNKPKTNDRIRYLFVDRPEIKQKTAPIFKFVEDPEHAKKHNLAIKSDYYLKAMQKPIQEILDLFGDKYSNIFV